ncbi:MAG: hypothetical protein HYR60_28675 [Acidobacteria bacterium]|nr:hypothetical protein [Acidobacteriota bacterium]
MTSPSAGFARLLEALDRLEIQYMVCGSVASSAHGIIRSTRDVDLVADLKEEHAGALVEELSGDFYIDAEMILSSLRAGRSFNLIHLASSYKFDIFPLSNDAYSRMEFSRRTPQATRQFGPEPLEFFAASAEDTLLAKLVWFRRGREVSDQQWNDARGVVEVKGAALDRDYLRRWAAHLHVDDLLERVLGQRHG